MNVPVGRIRTDGWGQWVKITRNGSIILGLHQQHLTKGSIIMDNRQGVSRDKIDGTVTGSCVDNL